MTSEATAASRLAALRTVMKKHNVQAYIIPSEDAHQSEYIADIDGRRGFISGFTGSAGLAVVTETKAALWTDGRYFLQASKQLKGEWTLMKAGLPEVDTKEEWLVKVLPKNSRIGLDPKLFTIAAAKLLVDAVKKDGHVLHPITDNLVDAIWEDQPKRPINPVDAYPVKYAGKESADKIKTVREQIAKKNAWGFVVTALDEIAWLFNLRGSDIIYNPVFFAYALVTKDQAILYVDESKVSDEVRSHLGKTVTIRTYDAIFVDLAKLGEEKKSEKLWLDSRCSLALQIALGGEERVLESRSPVQTAKAIKNDTELEGFRQSHIRDAAALCDYFAWLEKEIVEKGTKLTECEAADKLESLRTAQKDFVGLSFDTISSTGPNGAIIHYKPEPTTCATIKIDQLYLCDSGAQYKDGTTDVTRTISLNGKPSDHERDAFTRVLKGHIQIDLAVFPRGTTGYILDVLARTSLWQAGLDFRHGTGHGVGSFLNVHEGPHGIGTRIGFNDTPLEAGMSVTNEPGYYEDGNFGIRIENVLLIKEVKTKHNFGDRGYLGFEYVTLVPMQACLIDVELLVPAEREWLNNYHKKCWEKITQDRSLRSDNVDDRPGAPLSPRRGRSPAIKGEFGEGVDVPGPAGGRYPSRSPSRDRRQHSSRSRSRSPAPRHSSGPMRRGGPRSDLPEPEPSNVLGVFGLSLWTTEEDLERLFGEHGAIQNISIIYDRSFDNDGRLTKKSRGFGFITFDSIAGATSARKALNGANLHERDMRVDYSMTRRPHSPTPGKYMGREPRETRRGGQGGYGYRDGGNNYGGGGGGGRGYGGYNDRDSYSRREDHHRNRSPSPYRSRGRRSPSPRRRSRSPEPRGRY
ncbi:hypothetical protein HKX48_000717 [Thoreauomyces humboldtii]|nr:hypothetical protein HKX48_000717 [Thoreauomyces humboldtii]